MKNKYLLIETATGAATCERLTDEDVTERKAAGFTVVPCSVVAQAMMAESIATMMLMRQVMEAISTPESPVTASADPGRNWFCLAFPEQDKRISVAVRDNGVRIRVRKMDAEDADVLYEKEGISLNAVIAHVKAQLK